MVEDKEDEPTSSVVAENPIFVEQTPAIIPQEQNLQEENLQEQNKEVEESQEKSGISKKRQKRRRAITYLSHISKQVEKNGNQIDRITTLIQSLQKHRQASIATGLGLGQSQSQSIKQIQSQVSQLRKQVTRIQKDIQRIGTVPRTKAKIRKASSATAANIEPRSKISKARKGKRSR